MADLAVRMLRDCVTALESKDRESASLIIVRDQRIDVLEKEIDGACLEFLVRHQPAGAHLRFVYAALQINFVLERVGDYAESIARQIIKLTDLGCRIPSGLFAEITSASITMLRNAVTAFLRRDAEFAEATGRIEEQVDILRNQINTELMHLMQTSQLPLAALTPLMTIARRFERVSDQAKSICQETVYFCTGEFAKHSGEQVFRVLFVDDHHGCVSRMAEGIGRSLGHAGVEFASAGVAAKPLSAEAAAALQEKGFSIEPPMEVRDLPDFAQYQVVVALSPGAKSSLPAPTRKTAHLQWNFTDPCGNPGTPAQVREGLGRARQSLSQRISDLVRKLTADDKVKEN
jgi:phosphate transport system protein